MSEERASFSDILRQADRLISEPKAKDWLRQVNNLIGFTVGAKTSLDFLASMSAAKFCNAIDLFESAFEAINPSKVNVGKFRRELSSYYIAHLDDFSDSDLSEIENSFFEQTLTE